MRACCYMCETQTCARVRACVCGVCVCARTLMFLWLGKLHIFVLGCVSVFTSETDRNLAKVAQHIRIQTWHPMNVLAISRVWDVVSPNGFLFLPESSGILS